MQTESLNQLWAEWILKWLISDFSLLSSSTHSFILKCLGQRNKERQLLYSHNSSNAVRLSTLAGFKKQNKQTKTLKKNKIKKNHDTFRDLPLVFYSGLFNIKPGYTFKTLCLFVFCKPIFNHWFSHSGTTFSEKWPTNTMTSLTATACVSF